MLLSNAHNFAFLCTPKCASTSIEKALDSYCDIRMSKPSAIKHINARTFNDYFLPMYQHLVPTSNIETVCLIRNPIDWLFSWYRYRSRLELANNAHSNSQNYTGHINFNEFIEGYLSKGRKPSYAQVSSQYSFIKDSNNNVGIDLIFPFERLDLLLHYFEKKLNTTLEPQRLNVSPSQTISLDSSLQNKLFEYLQDDFDLYERAKAQGCYKRN